MLSPKGSIFLTEILSYVKFTLDREDIKKELESHILDKVEDYKAQGYEIEVAEQLSIQDMGDAKEIGVGLNKQHNPIIGWVWCITNFITLLTIIFFGFIIITIVSTIFQPNLIKDIPKSSIVYRIDLNEKVIIDDRVIRFTNIIYEKNGNMNIFYQSYYTSLWETRWSLSYIGEISDNLGNLYQSISGRQNTGNVCKGYYSINNFSKDAEVLIITYNWYNRYFKVEIPLKEGENNE